MASTTITALVRVPGLHCWPQAPPPRSYLRTPHRHLFHARAVVLVRHNDRDVEFHDLGDMIFRAMELIAGDAIEGGLIDFGAMSCESIAIALADRLTGHGLAVVQTSVSEDGEFTATYRP